MPLSQSQLEELIALEQKATSPNWREGVLWQDGAYPVGPYSRDEEQVKRDAKLLVEARNALPSLLQELKEWRSVGKRIKYNLETYVWDADLGNDELERVMKNRRALNEAILALLPNQE